jgi:hypothetical protein
MEASELGRALKILAHRMNDLHGGRAQCPGPGQCALLKAVETS